MKQTHSIQTIYFFIASRFLSFALFSIVACVFASFQCAEFNVVSVSLGPFLLDSPWGGFVASPEDRSRRLVRTGVQ